MTVISTLAPTLEDDVRIFPAWHSWSSEYSIIWEFLTDIITSGSGKEQRRAVRNYPRVNIEGSAVYWGEAKTLLDWFFASWQPYKAIMAVEPFSVTTAGYMPPDAQNVAIQNTGAIPNFLSGRVLIRHALRPGVMETRTISGVTAGAIQFADKSLTEFPPGSKVCVCAEGWAKSRPTLSRRTNGAGTFDFTFICDPGKSEFFNFTGTPKYVGGKEVFEEKPNWRERVEVSPIWDYTPTDYDYGLIGAPVEYKFPARTTKSSYLARSRTQALEAAAFFIRQQGKRGSFFLPTFEDDIPYRAITGGGKAILIEGTAFAYTYMDSTVYRRIVLRLADGTYSHHLVDYIEALPSGDSVLWVTDQLPVTELSRATVRGISWVLNSRFESDGFTLQFATSSAAQYSITTRSLENFEI